MRIINLLPVLSYGDAVGNDTIAIYNSCRNAGYDSVISATLTNSRIQLPVIQSGELETSDDDLIIYHLSTGDELNKRFLDMKGKKIIRYHNITPAEYFYGYNEQAMFNCVAGCRQIYALRKCADYILADSPYNLSDLRDAGYEAPGEVLPILIPFSDYEKEPDSEVVKAMDDGRTNILFTGRVVPNKRQEQVIRTFYHYKKKYDENARLIIAGNYEGTESYKDSLVDYANGLGIGNDVIMTGHISFAAILAYYHTADAFVCMSNHEGFCVPLVEAMYFDIPVIAKDTSAIASTLGGAGILLKDDDPSEAAGKINEILTHPDKKEELIKGQRERLKHFDHDRIEKRLLEIVASMVGRPGEE